MMRAQQMIAAEQDAGSWVPQGQVTLRVPGADHTHELTTAGGEQVPIPDTHDDARVCPPHQTLERGVGDSDERTTRGFRHAEPNEKLASALGVARPEQARAFGQTAHDPCARASGDSGRGTEMVGVRVGNDDLFHVAEAQTAGGQHSRQLIDRARLESAGVDDGDRRVDQHVAIDRPDMKRGRQTRTADTVGQRLDKRRQHGCHQAQYHRVTNTADRPALTKPRATRRALRTACVGPARH